VDGKKKMKRAEVSKIVSKGVPKIENIKKPQHAWWKDIDNSYNVFVPPLKDKPHGRYPVAAEIL